MRTRFFILACLAGLSFQAHADEAFSIADAMSSSYVKAILNPDVKLFWGTQAIPEVAMRSKAADYDRSENRSWDADSADQQCFKAFAGALGTIVAEARLREYDSVVGIRSNSDGKPTRDETTFECTGSGRRTVVLNASFALTRAAAELAEKARTDPAIVVPHALHRTVPPRKGAIFLPLATVLDSAQIKGAQGTLRLHAGGDTPTGYLIEEVPDDYSHGTAHSSIGLEAECYDAATRVVLRMIQNAREDGYAAVLRIRSYLNEQPAPIATDFECAPGMMSSTVTLISSFAKAK